MIGAVKPWHLRNSGSGEVSDIAPSLRVVQHDRSKLMTTIDRGNTAMLCRITFSSICLLAET
jgi:hypothetical protein